MIKWKNEVTELLKIKYPIIQAPMLGVTTPEMVAAISNNGGLGSLPVGGLSPEITLELILKTKRLTNKPFAVNLFAHDNAPSDLLIAEAMQTFLEKLCTDNQIPFKKQAVETFRNYSYTEQIDIIINENIPVVSFTFGIINQESIAALKARQVILIGTATCVKEAELLQQNEIDIVTAQGIEAGGHRGTFIEGEPLPLIGTISLVPQIARNVNLPILSAGGINDGKTIVAVFAMGAKGVQIGTAFIASDESMAIPSYKSAIQNASETDSILTKSFSGRWARGLKNKFITEVENSGLQIPEYPVQTTLAAPIRKASQQQNNKDFTALWAGQSPSGSQSKPATQIFLDIIRQAEAISK